MDIAYILLYCIQLTAVDGVHRGGADFARRYIADRGAIAAFQRDFVFIDSAAAVHIVFDSAVRNSFQLVFGRRLAAGDILCVPGSIGQTADRAGTAVDSDLIGRNNAVGTIHIDITGTDRTVIAVDSDFIGAAADLDYFIQLQLVIDAAAVISGFCDDKVTVACRYRALLRGQLDCFRRRIVDRFQLVFRCRLPAGDIIRVPGSIGQTVDRACIIFIDRHTAGSYRTVAAVDDHIAVTDFDLTVAGAVYFDARTDLQLISQLHFVIGAAAAVGS